MTKSESDAGPREQTPGAGQSPQTLAQLQATGAEVVGSDGEKIGDLKTVGDADFVVGRTLRGDLRLPVNRIQEVTSDGKVVLDVPADQATDLSPDRKSTDTAGGAESFSDSSEVEKGAWELKKENTD
jgi:hypothetical protein